LPDISTLFKASDKAIEAYTLFPFFNILYHQFVTNLLHSVAGFKFFYKAKGGEDDDAYLSSNRPVFTFPKIKKALQPQDDVSLGNRLPNQAIELRRMIDFL
jgi:hypothetical protein